MTIDEASERYKIPIKIVQKYERRFKMKKIVSILMVLTLIFSFAACSNDAKKEETSPAAPQSEAPSSAPVETGSKSLVVYFSWSGNTENVAESIQSQTDSDIFKIVPETPYSDDYDTVVDLAQEEQSRDARPAIADSIDNIEEYDVIYVGFPNWWGDMPMILYTFFDTYDLSGKTIAPFCTSGGSGLSGTVDSIKSLEPNAAVTEGLHIGESSASNPDDTVSQWLSEIGAGKQADKQ